MDIVFSGIQPTGVLHLGNYLGAITNWVELQQKYNALFCVVDLHAITSKYSVKDLKKNITHTIATYISCGIKPENIFVQSTIKEHAELQWLLNSVTPYGWLDGMTQFKNKSVDNIEKVSLGVYNYPMLMAADILLYKSKYVPVGDDQKQHLELTNKIVARFNSKYKTNYFQHVDILLQNQCSRIMSLKDGNNKMSKSDESDVSRINITDSPDEIIRKINGAKTDSHNDFTTNLKNRPEINNLMNIYSVLSGVDKMAIGNKFLNYKDFKRALADILIVKLSPIANNIKKLSGDEDYAFSLISKGRQKALQMAENNIKEIKLIMGL